MGDTDTLDSLDTFSLALSSLRQDVETMLKSALGVDRETRLFAIQEYPPRLWPRLDQILADLDRLAIEQQAKLVNVRARANHASDVTLALLIVSNVFAFVAGAAVLSCHSRVGDASSCCSPF